MRVRDTFRRYKKHLVAFSLAAPGILALLLIPAASNGRLLPASPQDYSSLLSLLNESSPGDSTRNSRGPAKGGAPIITPSEDDSKNVGRHDDVRDSTSRKPTKPDDSTASVSDTSYVVFLDSTARLAHFNYVRRDPPYVELFPDRVHPLFAKAKTGTYRREVSVDSLGSIVTFRESVGGMDTRVPLNISLKEYVRERRKFELHKMLADEARKPPLVAVKNDLGELLENITKLNIPIPSNPIFSIFGKPEIRLNISGAVDIKAGFRNTKSDQTQLASADQSRNEPDFSQEVQVNVNGTIGDKLNILADWNTQRTFEYENQLKIKYTGYDDEIVQSIEAGNVSLTTPSSFIGSSQALFGIKAQFQAGPLRLTALASQKKGQIKEVAVSGGAQKTPFDKRAYDYATNNYFVDTSYVKDYEPYYLNDPPLITPEMVNSQIVDEEVWVTRTGVPDPNERQAIAYIELPFQPIAGYDSTLRGGFDSAGVAETGRFIKLQRSQYELAGDGYLGVLSLNTNIQENQIVAIAYRRADGAQTGELIRDYGTDTSRTIVLKLVKPKNLGAQGSRYSIAWRQLLKNIYSLGGRNLKESGFSLDIKRITEGAELQNSIAGEPLLKVLGVDRYNTNGTPLPEGDGQFDFRKNITVNLTRAEVIFPYLEPFRNGMIKYFTDKGLPVDSTFIYPEVYDETKTIAQQTPVRDKYRIMGEATGDATSKYSLGFNVVEGSVEVLLDGRQLTPNLDFTVDYIVGEVIIRNDQALVPGANLQIKYEQNDLFQLASKTLLGARGDIALGRQTNLGFTVMNLNQLTLSDKVRLGEEPNKNTIFGIDGATTIDLPLLTKAIDALPLLNTRDASGLRLSGELAYMLPDPNTKKSTIPTDGGEGIAYIDDFEGARRTIPFGVSFSQWTLASPPDSITPFLRGPIDTTKVYSKGKLIWYNNLNQITRLTEVYPNKKPGNAANDRITVLDLAYYPTERGQFNYSTDLVNTLRPNQNWGGIMKPISVSATNLINENINFIEIWMKVDSLTASLPNQQMVIDMGAISEDVIPNRQLNDEDYVISHNPNGTLQEGEDVGLDMMSDAQEVARYPTLGPDPSGDDYSFQNTSSDYSKINGTDNNKNGPSGQIPDTEDLNGNGVVDYANSFFEYHVPLNANPQNNPLIVGGGNEGWYQYRIPLRDFARQVGSPSFENVEYVRISFLNAQENIRVRIADFSLVGSQWQEQRKGDSTFAVSVISVEDNPYYTSPPGVIRERDKTRPDEEVFANEQSLSLLVTGLPEGESRIAVKFYNYKPLDVFSYRTMKMFVHGDTSLAYNGEGNYDAEYFFRFGADTANYYEYRAPLHPDWDPLNEMVVKFNDLTGIKQGRDSTNRVDSIAVPGGPPGAYYLVRGNPSLTQIRALAIGVRNPTGIGTTQPIHGQVWVNELRLTSVDDAPGLAYRMDAQLKLADLGAVSFNYSKIDPNFHTLDQRFGSRQTGINWGVNTSLQLEKFFPNDWAGTSLPVSYSHTEALINPKYLTNSDILVSEASDRERDKIIGRGGTEADANAAAEQIRFESETLRKTDTYAAPNFRIGLPSNAWYVRDTWNKLAFGFSYTKSTEHNPAVVNSLAWQWNARIGYALNLPTDNFISPFRILFDGIWFLDEYKDMKIFSPITTFSWSVAATRSRNKSLQRATGSREIISRNFSASRSFSFGWKLIDGGPLNLAGDYNLNIESSLLVFETDQYGNQRSFSKILDDIFLNGKLINFGDDQRYTQRNTFTTRPTIPNIFNIKKFFDLSFGYGVDYSWNNTLTAGDIGKSAGFSNNINASTNIRLKQIFDPLFEDAPPSLGGGYAPQPRGRRSPEVPGRADSTGAADTSRVHEGGGINPLGQIKSILKVIIKTPFLDYDNVNVTFTQQNTAQNSGVLGKTGFGNFWGRVPFFQDSDPKYGPSRLYQLGLITDPHGKLTNFGFRPEFPFFGWDVEPGPRAAGAILVNQFRQANKVALKTSRALWEGAHIDLNWNLGWTYARTQNIKTDSLGLVTIQNSTTTGGIERSFLTFPDVLFLGVFKTGLKQVSKRYAELKSGPDSTGGDAEKLAQAFEEGFEALPIFRKLFGQYYPRINWSLRWDGLEKLSMFSGFVTRLSLDHAYQATYARQFRNLPGTGFEQTDGQRVMYGFAPLIGLNFTFKDLFKGSMGANVRYNTNTSYDLQTSSRNIVETLAQEISITMSYNRRGFEIPLFGLALNNDVDVSASYSITKNTRRQYEVARLDVNAEGSPLDGTTRTVIEPRIRYILSSRVTASIYYRYTKVAPDDSGSRIPGSTTNEAGLDVHISIQ